MPAEQVFTADVHGKSCFCLYILSEGYIIVPVLPESELLSERNMALLIMGVVEIIFFVGLFFILFLLLRRHQAVTAETARIEHELTIAKQIQESALPAGISPFPDREEFSLHNLSGDRSGRYCRTARFLWGIFIPTSWFPPHG